MRLHAIIFAILGALLFIQHANAYQILGIFPTMARSHFITGSALMKGLAAAGHEVTVISPFPQKTPIKNYRDIAVVGIIEIMEAKLTNILELNNKGFIEMSTEMIAMGILITNYTLQHDVTQTFLRDPNEHFDAVIIEIFLTEPMLGFGHHFNAPVIGFSTFGASKWTNDLVGSPSPPSYVPSVFLSFTDKMSFVERFLNTMLSVFENILYVFYMDTQQKVYEAAFPRKNKPDLDVLRKNVSLVLLNNHFTMSYPRPYVPNMIEVGGIHINRNAVHELPENIKEFIDSAKYGVIYFSMGSNIKSSQLPTDIRDGILKAFAKLKQKVLWKWEEPNLPGKPDNVFISNWFPQDDILAHPNVKLFITHGGLLSSTEAVYHGVPIIGIPVYGDQSLNMGKAVRGGYGISIDYPNLSESTLTEALNEMLNNRKYAKQAKAMSARYRDQPLQPLETAVYWVEYIVRHRGAPHLRSAGQDLCWFTYHSLDVYGLLLLVILAVLYGFKRLIQGIFCQKSKTNVSSDKKKR